MKPGLLRLTALRLRSRNRHRASAAWLNNPGINPALARSRPWNPIKGPWRLAMSEFDHDHNDQAPDDGSGVSRRRVLECMTWAGTGVLWTISGGVPRSLGLVGAAQAAAAGRPDIPADQRQPCRLRQAGQPECDRHPRGGDRQDQRHAGKAVIHDPHRRHHPFVEGRRIRQRRTHHLAGQARRALRAGRTRFPRRRRSSSIASATGAAPRVPAGIRSTPAASTSSVSSMW